MRLDNYDPAPTRYERDRGAWRRASRHFRPETPTVGVALQPRDLKIIDAVRRYRYLTSHHLRQLFFSDGSLRAAQMRLRRLWEHHYLERLYLPLVARAPSSTALGQPIYIVGRAGARVLGAEPGGLGTAGQRLQATTAILHHLVVSDFLVALTLAGRAHPHIDFRQVLPEAELWPQVMAYRRTALRPTYLVPDGAFTMGHGAGGVERTFYLEVVRADPRGGRKRFREKLERYARLHHAGAFAEIFGHAHLRAVLFVAPSTARADNLLEMACQLRHGRRLFWFGAYEAVGDDGQRASTLTPELILTPRWRSADEEKLSLTSPGGVSAVG